MRLPVALTLVVLAAVFARPAAALSPPPAVSYRLGPDYLATLDTTKRWVDPGARAARLVSAGRVLLIVGVSLLVVSGIAFIGADAAVRSEQAKAAKDEADCRARGGFLCGLFDLQLAGLPETLLAYTFLTAAIGPVLSGVPILAIGKLKQKRLVEVRPGLTLLSTPGDVPRAATSGLSLALHF